MKERTRYGKILHSGNRVVLRDIEGDYYDFDSDHATKEEAQERAKEIRTPIHKVRVIKGYAADGGYDVWILRYGTKKAMRNLGILK